MIKFTRELTVGDTHEKIDIEISYSTNSISEATSNSKLVDQIKEILNKSSKLSEHESVTAPSKE